MIGLIESGHDIISATLVITIMKWNGLLIATANKCLSLTTFLACLDYAFFCPVCWLENIKFTWRTLVQTHGKYLLYLHLTLIGIESAPLLFLRAVRSALSASVCSAEARLCARVQLMMCYLIFAALLWFSLVQIGTVARWPVLLTNKPILLTMYCLLQIAAFVLTLRILLQFIMASLFVYLFAQKPRRSSIGANWGGNLAHCHYPSGEWSWIHSRASLVVLFSGNIFTYYLPLC